MTVSTFVQPNFTTQTAAVYKAALDAAIAVLATAAADYACHAKAAPDMQVQVDAGQLFLANSTLVSNAQQTSITIVAPVGNPRIDRIVINDQTGVMSVVTGTPAASPVAPAITAGTRPIAQILLQTSSTVITNSMITDERVVTTFDVSTFMRTLLLAVDSAAARATLVAAGLAVPNTFTATQTISSTSPRLVLVETDAAADNQRWDITAGAERIAIRVLNDADNTSAEIVGVERTGTVIDSVTIGGTTVAVNNALTVGGLATLTGGQLKFPATQLPSTNVNTLDDYEEGTWTPSIGGTATYVAQNGTYVKIGKTVFINCYIEVSAIGTGSTTVISGLPFASSNETATCIPVSVWINIATSSVFVAGFMNAGSSSISVEATPAASISNGGGGNPVFKNLAAILLSGAYRTS